MILLSQLLDKLYKAEACIFKPVSERDLREVRMIMAKKGLPAIPSDYLQFLSLADGLIFNGLHFFGVREHNREVSVYTFPDIMSVNEDFQRRNRRKDILIIGEKDEDLIVYRPKERLFQLMDKLDLIGDLNLPRFFDVVYFFNQELIENQNIATSEKK